MATSSSQHQNGNGNGTATATLSWEPETPFANAPGIGYAEGASFPQRPYAGRASIETPFSAEYSGDVARPSEQGEAFAALMGELHDTEFAEALEDLVNDASGVLEERFSGEIGDPLRERVAMERTLDDYLQPARREAEAMLDRMSTGLGERDLGALTEAELEALLDEFTPPEGELSPAFEGFLGGLLKKAKSAVKSAVKVASKIAQPHLLILGRLKGLVRPLLERVLRFAMNKLPVSLRPMAKQLAERFLGVRAASSAVATGTQPAPADAQRVDAAAADPAAIQEELDARIAGYLLAGEDFGVEEEAEALTAERDAPLLDPMYELERARGEFARGVVQLQEGEDPGPQLEQFVPAILAALKLGVKIVGRPRVVKFLSGLVSQLISRYVGQSHAPALSTAMVDAGLRLVSLEVRDEPEAAGSTLAATVEDTLTRVVHNAPSAAWENEAVLEAYVHEAFQEAASAHFPDPLIRAELHEASTATGAWVALPLTSPRKRYKKYSAMMQASITPQIAEAVKTFAGISLKDFLKDRLGISVTQPVQARVHLYESVPGTRLSLVALHERGVAGLGNGSRGAWSLFHPLTPEAAGLLFNEPGIGKAVPAEFLVRRRVTAVGQRFFYLEIPGSRVRLAPRAGGHGSRPARSTQTRVVLDFVKRQLRVGLYYSEADAQEIAKQLRQKLPVSVLLKALKARHDGQLVHALSGAPSNAIRIIHEAAPTEEMASPLIASAMRIVGRPLADAITMWVLDALKRELELRLDRFAGEFERAAQADEDGLTIVATLDAPAVLEQIRRVMQPGGAGSAPAAIAALLTRSVAGAQLEVRAGFAKV